MGHVENLRDIKQVGRMLARAREKQARSLSDCAGLLGLKNQDFVGKIGSKGYISSILNKRKPMTLEIARIFHRELKIPAEILLS